MNGSGDAQSGRVGTRCIVGIAGGTGAGKTTIAQWLERALAPLAVVLPHDAYYRDRPDLTPDERRVLNYDHPDALDNDLLVEHLDRLRAGRAIERPVYDFVTHRRCQETVHVAPRPVVILEGILIFAEPRLRERMDVRLYVDTDADIRVLRRIRRDIERRGRDFASVREQYYRTVRPMHLQFVEPSKRHADLIIPEGHHGNLDRALEVILDWIRRMAS